MSIIRSGFSTNLMHFCNVMSRPKKIQRKYYYYYLKDRQISRVVRTPSCNENLYILCQSPRPAHGGQPSVGSLQPTAHGGPFRIGFPYPVGSDKLILSIYSHRHIPSLSFSIYLRTNLCVYLIKCVLVYLCTCVLVQLFTCVLVYVCACVLMYLSTRVLEYLFTCLLVNFLFVYLFTCLPIV